VVDSVASADLLGIIQRLGRVSVCNDVDMRCREDTERGPEGSTDDGGRSVAGDQESSVRGGWSDTALLIEVWSWGIIFEGGKEWRIRIAAIA
jgi:hypothetical protein